MNHEHFTSRMLTGAGALLTISGIILAVCASILYSGILWAAASCMFFAAYHFRLAENNKAHARPEEQKPN